MSKDDTKIKAEKQTEEKTSDKSSKKDKKAPKDGVKQPNKVVKYFKDLRSEFKKVVWPTKKQVVNNTLVVLVTMIVVGLFVGGLDFGLTALLDLILSR